MRIAESRLRQVIRAVINEDVNPGSGMGVAVQKGNAALKQDRRKIVEDELTKTYDWFKNTVFPAVEGNDWPITADQDYSISFMYGAMDGNADPNTTRRYIKKGTNFLSADEKKQYGFAPGDALSKTPLSLTELYSELEDSVLSFKLNVPMESFPG